MPRSYRSATAGSSGPLSASGRYISSEKSGAPVAATAATIARSSPSLGAAPVGL